MSGDEKGPPLPPRYRWRAALGVGGMGEVHRVEDTVLGRWVALKLLKAGVHGTDAARFLEEAQVAAQLEHPSIVPVYDFGVTPDGRRFFTMKEVKGRTLRHEMRDILRAEARARRLGGRFHRLMGSLLRVCEAVAYAHDRGVVHRDLKPSNVMIGTFGEVLVLDWGLAKVVGSIDPDVDSEEIETVRSHDDSLQTVAGRAAGTPSYMPPEQVRGDHLAIGPPSDVWALGVILYQSLTGHRPLSLKGRALLDAIVGHEPIVPPHLRGAPWEVPEALAALAMDCLQRDPDRRPGEASVLVARIGAWMDGDSRARRAREEVQRASLLGADVQALRAEAADLEARGQTLLAEVPERAPEQQRWAAWASLDGAARARDDAEAAEVQQVRALRDALLHDPVLPEAHETLATLFRRAHRRAETAGRHREARRLAADLAAHDRGAHRAYLEGTGAVTVHTSAPVEVLLYRLVERNRRRVPELERSLGETPLSAVPLPMGSWLLRFGEVTLPVFVGRGEHVDHVAPGQRDPVRFRVPDLPDGDRYVPAGYAWLGHRSERNALPWQHGWVDGFVLRRFGYTWGELARLCNWLEATGRGAAADALAPHDERQLPLLARGGQGAWGTVEDPEGFRPDDEHPVYCASFDFARRVAALEAERTGLPWRLPTEREWEKAARGVDGRDYPWGDVFDGSRAWLRSSWGADDGIVVPRVGAVAADRSVYGVRDLCGGMTDWATDDDGRQVLRGGAWNRSYATSTSWYRWVPGPHQLVSANLGLRLARSLTPAD